MRFARYVAHMGVEVIRYGLADRHYGLILVIVAGSLFVLLALAAHTVAPVALYPFV